MTATTQATATSPRPRSGSSRDRFPAIEDHGLIGDLQTIALVATDGTIDWYCCPRFDSPSVFASILDPDRGGRFRIAPAEPDCVTKQLYFPDSAVLITRFISEAGVGEVVDFMPVHEPERAHPRRRLVRIVRVVRGTMTFTLECAPRFDYGRQPHSLELVEGGAVFHTPSLRLALSGRDLERRGDDVVATRTMSAGDVAGVMLESEPEESPRRLSQEALLDLFESTVNYWRRWLNRSTYSGRWREQVMRSAMTLRLLTYAPTGAVVAAPTAALPEQVGGERNWDYRFTWVRDASFSVYALLGLGYVSEAEAFMRWLGARIGEGAGDGSGPLKIMYRVDGSSDLVEETLDHLEGYRGSRPVRIGNGAADQLQLDIYGEALDSLYLGSRAGVRVGHPGWLGILKIARWLTDNWNQPEEGIWETRGGRQNFSYGRLMSWVALDRVIRFATELGLPADLDRIRVERDRIYWQVMERGWNPERGAFVQYEGSEVLDAALLLMPRVGFIAPRDPMWLSTLERMREELVSDSLVYRYNPSASPDGLRGDEGTFSLCTFWYVDALARAGQLDRARMTFEKMHTYANHLGLYGEEIGRTGEQLGNFPQAFTHLALINSALDLHDLLERTRNGADFTVQVDELR